MSIVMRIYYGLPRSLQIAAKRTVGRVIQGIAPVRLKRYGELQYWRKRRNEDTLVSGHHYVHFYTAHFGLSEADYAGRAVLDIGCGPRGSLEWASMAGRRVGLDPLAEAYMELGARDHAMEYVAAPAEAIPFEDGHFDIITSFNSLDHVDDLGRSIGEIKRVLKPGGLFLLITDVGHAPTICEPQRFSWDIVEAFGPELEVEALKRFETCAPGVYKTILADRPFDRTNPAERRGVLSAKFRKASGL